MDINVHYDQVCRICLQISQMSYDIFTSLYVKGNILYCDMILDCTKIKPYQGDGLPRVICRACSRRLKRSYSFNKLCEDSDRKLRHRQDSTCISPSIKNESDLKFTNDLDRSCNDTRNVNVETNIETKEEIKIKTRNVNVDINTEFNIPISKEAKEHDNKEIKNEMGYDDGCTWNADDDNMVLGQIKLNKCLEELAHHSISTKKRRKTKKRAYVTNSGGSEVPSSKLPHQCDVCGKVLSTRSNMQAHKICHTDLRPYSCDACPATFRGHSALFQHKKKHTGETPYQCTFCPKQFSRRTGLVNHVRMHTGEKLYTCDICLKAFVQSAQLSIHMKRHKGDKPFLCQDCGKGFPIKADLKVHQRIHNGEKPYSCHMCTKTFATAGNLSIHIRIHNKDIRYNCKECTRGFVTASAFAVHVKRHKGQRDYGCECGKTFYTSSALKQHRVVHTGEKRYQCKICERKFTQTSHLSRHFKRDHSDWSIGKPNAPVPASDHYKLVVRNSNEPFLAHAHPSQETTLKCATKQ